MLILRPYQEQTLGALRAGFKSGNKKQMLYLSTGGGKTEISIAMMEATAKSGHRVAMVLDRRILVDQTSERLDKYNIDHGVLMSGHWRYRPYEPIQICSAQTLEKCESFPDIDLLIVDEAHTVRKSISDYIKNTTTKTIGLSASPFTKGLGKIYSGVVSVITTEELVKSGSLVPLRVFISKEIDMSGAKKVAGEWSQCDATKRGIEITGDVVSEWVKKTHQVFGKPEKTIIFCAGVAHGADLQDKFSKAGYNFVSVSYKDDDEFKREVIAEFSKSESDIHGLIATDILTKGFDVPSVKIGVSARPFSKSLSSHVQQMGRVMRPCADKEFALWLDHSGNYLRFKNDWEELYHCGVEQLDDGKEKTKKEPTKEEKEAAKCPKCSHLWPAKSDVCACCGFVRERKNKVEVKPGELIELGNTIKDDADEKRSFYQELLGYCKEKDYQEGWAYYKYLERYGVKPRWSKEAINPTRNTLNWILSRKIAHQKASKK